MLARVCRPLGTREPATSESAPRGRKTGRDLRASRVGNASCRRGALGVQPYQEPASSMTAARKKLQARDGVKDRARFWRYQRVARTHTPSCPPPTPWCPFPPQPVASRHSISALPASVVHGGRNWKESGAPAPRRLRRKMRARAAGRTRVFRPERKNRMKKSVDFGKKLTVAMLLHCNSSAPTSRSEEISPRP